MREGLLLIPAADLDVVCTVRLGICRVSFVSAFSTPPCDAGSTVPTSAVIRAARPAWPLPSCFGQLIPARSHFFTGRAGGRHVHPEGQRKCWELWYKSCNYQIYLFWFN